MRILAVALAAGLTVCAVATTSTQATQKSRTIPFSASIPIESRVAPGDEIVVIEKGGTATMHDAASTLTGKGPLGEQLDILARADGIVVGDILRSHGELVENGTWIHTILSVGISQVIRATRPIGKDGIVEIAIPNGEVMLRGSRSRPESSQSCLRDARP